MRNLSLVDGYNETPTTPPHPLRNERDAAKNIYPWMVMFVVDMIHTFFGNFVFLFRISSAVKTYSVLSFRMKRDVIITLPT